MQTQNALTWFEIPVTDMQRATTFYERVLARSFGKEQFGPEHMTVFAYTQPGVGGCLTQQASLKPGSMGSLVYLPVDDSLQAALARVTQAGGQVALGETALPQGLGCYAHIIDSEGNRVGLHAPH